MVSPRSHASRCSARSRATGSSLCSAAHRTSALRSSTLSILFILWVRRCTTPPSLLTLSSSLLASLLLTLALLLLLLTLALLLLLLLLLLSSLLLPLSLIASSSCVCVCAIVHLSSLCGCRQNRTACFGGVLTAPNLWALCCVVMMTFHSCAHKPSTHIGWDVCPSLRDISSGINKEEVMLKVGASMLLRRAPAATSSLASRAAAMCTTSKPFAILVTVKIKPERTEEFLQVMHADAEGSRSEPDCLRFDLLKDEKDPNKFYFYEVYKNSNEAIDYHKSMEWYKAWTAFKDSGGVEEQYASKAIAINYTAP